MSKLQPNIITDQQFDEIHQEWERSIWSIKDERQGSTMIQTMDKLFPVQDIKRDFMKWLLNLVYISITERKDFDKLDLLQKKLNSTPTGSDLAWARSVAHDSTTEVPKPEITGYKAWLARANPLNLLHPKNIEMIKKDICSWNITDCTDITNNTIKDIFEHCQGASMCLHPPEITEYLNSKYKGAILFKDMLSCFWAFDKYWRTDKILEYYVYKAYIEQHDNADWWSILGKIWLDYSNAKNPFQSKDPFVVNHNQYMLPYYAWHFLHGTLLAENDQFTPYVNWLPEHTNDPEFGYLHHRTIQCLINRDELCKGEYDLLKGVSEKRMKLLESWMNQPKVHGDEYEDYILVPLCSFAENHLKKCELFKPSELNAQDQKCFTYDGQRHANVGSLNGFKFLLNLKNIPHDKGDQPLSVDLYLHESGSYPDIFNVKTFPTKILADEQMVNIGVSITDRKITNNFEAMAVEKRKCIITSISQAEKYTRVNCVMDTIYDLSAKKCGCAPRNMDLQSKPICDFDGALCFRESTSALKLGFTFNTSLCKQECTGIQYNANKRVEGHKEVLSQGSEYADYLYTNPIGDLIHGNEKMKSNATAESIFNHITELHLDDIGKRYSLVQVYFENPMKNVVTQDAKFTLAGMVSNIGGTLGIFLGLSMITLFDDLFQVFMYFKDVLKNWPLTKEAVSHQMNRLFN